ncbi:MAG: PTS galactitol transporter subunit IIC [Firmicutes bacterium]|nr:PTS galactitol transporter subunit IIC [Bacillota bacterium]
MDLGATVMMPIVILILGLVFRQPFGKALRSGLTVGFGFVGIGVVIGLFFNNMAPAAEALVKNSGVHLTALDVGWPAAAAIAFGTQIGALVFAVGILTNLVMLLLRWTKTLDIDIWNYWHWALSGSLVLIATGNLWMGVAAVVIHAVYTLKMADYTAPRLQQFFNFPGVSISHGWAMASMPIVMPLVWLVDRIPGINNITADPEAIQKNLGVVGQPTVLGTVLGIVVGLLARFNIQKTLQLGVAMGAVFLLLPRVVAILMEGLTPLSEAARDFLRKRAGNRDIYIGMDSALLIGHPTNLAAALILVPITLLLAVILPGNRMLPFGDLAATPFFVVMVTPWTRGNLVKTVIVGTLLMAIIMYMGSDWADFFTRAASQAGFTAPQGATVITGFGNPIAWLILKIARLFS